MLFLLCIIFKIITKNTVKDSLLAKGGDTVNAEVDKDTCIGCGLCTGIVPDVFEIVDDGKAEALGMITEDNKGSVQEAIDSCPTSAIGWEE